MRRATPVHWLLAGTASGFASRWRGVRRPVVLVLMLVGAGVAVGLAAARVARRGAAATGDTPPRGRAAARAPDRCRPGMPPAPAGTPPARAEARAGADRGKRARMLAPWSRWRSSS